MSQEDSSQAGFSLVEILLACAIFAMTVTAIIGAVVYGYTASANAGNREQAVMLADEGVQAARNIRNAGYANLSLGTFGVATTGGVYGLTGTSDTSGMFTRAVTVASGGTNRKTVTSTVSWTDVFGGARSYSTSTQFTNWLATLKSWPGAIQYGQTTTSACSGYRVDTAGKYAYIVLQGCTPNFYVVDISNTSSPTVVGSTTLTGTLNDVRISGNYAYVASSDSTKEFQVVNVTTPTAPALAGSFNASGTAAGTAMFITGNFAFMARAANGGNGEMSIFNISNPASPTFVFGYNNNVAMTDVLVQGNYAYLSSSNGSVFVIDVSSVLTGVLSLLVTGTYTPAGTGSTTSIDAYGSNLLFGRGSTFSTASIGALGVPTALGSVATTGTGTVNYIDSDATSKYAFVGTSYTAGEFQIINLATIGTPVVSRTVDITGTTSNLTGVAYNPTYDVVIGASAYTAGNVQVFGKN